MQNQLTNVQGDGNSLVTQLNNLGIDASFLSSVLLFGPGQSERPHKLPGLRPMSIVDPAA